MSSYISNCSKKIEDLFIQANEREQNACYLDSEVSQLNSFGRIFKQIISSPFSFSGRTLQLALHSINCSVALAKGNSKQIEAELSSMRISFWHAAKVPGRLLFLPISLFYATFYPEKEAQRTYKIKSEDTWKDKKIEKLRKDVYYRSETIEIEMKQRVEIIETSEEIQYSDSEAKYPDPEIEAQAYLEKIKLKMQRAMDNLETIKLEKVKYTCRDLHGWNRDEVSIYSDPEAEAQTYLEKIKLKMQKAIDNLETIKLEKEAIKLKKNEDRVACKDLKGWEF